MRPFKIPGRDRWVDLDAVQEIREPYFDDQMGRGGFWVKISYRLAFQDQPVEIWDQVAWKFSADSRHNLLDPAPADWRPPPDHTEGSQFRIPYLGAEPEDLVKMRREVFVPFWEAWTGRTYDGTS